MLSRKCIYTIQDILDRVVIGDSLASISIEIETGRKPGIFKKHKNVSAEDILSIKELSYISNGDNNDLYALAEKGKDINETLEIERTRAQSATTAELMDTELNLSLPLDISISS